MAAPLVGSVPPYGVTDAIVHLDLETCSTKELRQAINQISRTLETRLDSYEKNNHKLVAMLKQYETGPMR